MHLSNIFYIICTWHFYIRRKNKNSYTISTKLKEYSNFMTFKPQMFIIILCRTAQKQTIRFLDSYYVLIIHWSEFNIFFVNAALVDSDISNDAKCAVRIKNCNDFNKWWVKRSNWSPFIAYFYIRFIAITYNSWNF